MAESRMKLVVFVLLFVAARVALPFELEQVNITTLLFSYILTRPREHVFSWHIWTATAQASSLILLFSCPLAEMLENI